MMADDDLVKFWSSIITEKEFMPHIKQLMEIGDLEERAFSFLSRITYLWFFGMKFERDLLASMVQKIEDLVISKPNSSCSTCANIELLIQKYPNKSQEEGEEKSTIKTCSSPLKKRVQETPSPEKKQKKCKSNKENIQRSPKQAKFGKILAFETQHLPQEKIPDPECEAFIIPETALLDQVHYGSTDVFEVEGSGSEGSCPRVVNEGESPILGKQNKANLTLTPFEGKRVLQHKNFPVVHERRVSYSSKKLFSSPVKAIQEQSGELIHTPESASDSPSLLGCQRLKSSQTLLKAEVVDQSCKGNPNLVSPNWKESSFGRQESYPHSSLETPLPHPAIPVSSKKNKAVSSEGEMNVRQSPRKKSFPKSKSELSTSLSKHTKLSRLKKLSTLKQSKLTLEFEIDTSTPIKKKYRQTKITPECFLKKVDVAKLTGGLVEPRTEKKEKKPDDEDKILRQAIEESLRTKKAEEVLRHKQEQLDQENTCQIKRLKPQKVQDECDGKAAQLLDDAVKRTLCAQNYREMEETARSVSSKAPQMAEEEVLDQLEEEPEARCRDAVENERKKIRNKRFCEDSFDLLPSQKDEPHFAYKGEVVRKKEERKRLEGWDCHECRDYYNANGATDAEKKEMQDKCSRHRSKHRTVTNTPKGFWMVGWDDE